MASVPEQVVRRLEARLRAHVRDRWGRIQSLSVRPRGAFVYVEVQVDGQEELEPVCRLRYLGNERDWEFAYFSWSRGNRGGYEPSYLSNGLPFGSPEECFDCAAGPWQ